MHFIYAAEHCYRQFGKSSVKTAKNFLSDFNKPCRQFHDILYLIFLWERNFRVWRYFLVPLRRAFAFKEAT